MHWIKANGINCLQFPGLAERIEFVHGVFLRTSEGGSGERGDFNLGLGQGTPDHQVWENRKRMLDFFGPGYKGIYARQVHGKGIGTLRKLENSLDLQAVKPIRLDGDALITDMAGGALVIQVADCQPVLIIDPHKKVVANIHSGWRGSIQNIIGTTIGRMVGDFKCRPEDLICGIGPSLGPCCAEFINYQDEIPEFYWKYRWSENLFDFWQISVDQLTGSGVKSGNISLSGLCTRCNQHLFYSYRGKRNSGRFAAVVGIRPVEGNGV